jgi:hypothetical protein
MRTSSMVSAASDQLRRLRLALVNLARAWWRVHLRRQPAETPEDGDLTS